MENKTMDLLTGNRNISHPERFFNMSRRFTAAGGCQ